MDTPYKIDRLPNQLHYTYLDTFGRPVLVATKTNLVEHHIQDVVVSARLKIADAVITSVAALRLAAAMKTNNSQQCSAGSAALVIAEFTACELSKCDSLTV